MTPPKDTIIQVTCKLCFARSTGEEAVFAFYSSHLTNPRGEFYFISTIVHFLLVGDPKRAVRKIASVMAHRVDLDGGPGFGIRGKLSSSASDSMPGYHINLQIKNTPVRSVLS
jgi:hypothetical protein